MRKRAYADRALSLPNPLRLLGALPKRSWLKRLRRLGLEVLIPLWRHAASASEATRSRWQWTWVGDDSVFKKYGEQLGLVGTWWSGQEKRVLSGIDGVLLVVVIGDGKLVVPVDFAIRRPNPTGPGVPCRNKLCWVQVMLDGRQGHLVFQCNPDERQRLCWLGSQPAASRRNVGMPCPPEQANRGIT